MQATEARPAIEVADRPAGPPRRRRRKSLLAAALVVVALTSGVAVRAVDADRAHPGKPLPSGLFSGIDAPRDGVDAAGSYVPAVTTAPTVDPAFAGGTGD